MTNNNPNQPYAEEVYKLGDYKFLAVSSVEYTAVLLEREAKMVKEIQKTFNEDYIEVYHLPMLHPICISAVINGRREGFGGSVEYAISTDILAIDIGETPDISTPERERWIECCQSTLVKAVRKQIIIPYLTQRLERLKSECDNDYGDIRKWGAEEYRFNSDEALSVQS